MKRILMVLTWALMLVTMLAVMATPAFTDRGPFVSTPVTGTQACTQSQLYYNAINPQLSCAKNP
jgi:hypothetical protein